MFSESDIKQIEAHQLFLDTVRSQIENYKKGFPPSDLVANITLNDGLCSFTESEANELIRYYESNLEGLDIVKFVPASGAASRMFKKLFAFLDSYEDDKAMAADQGEESIFTFFKEIEKFAFYPELKDAYQKSTGNSLQEGLLKKEYPKIIDTLLDASGMNYGSLPKGLLKFHQYGEESRTPVEEHMVEGAQYAQDSNGNVKIHFTVSPSHLSKFKEHVAAIAPKYESAFGVKLEVTYSVQNPATDTIAVDMNNEPFRNEDGSILLRPAGHGAILENLNKIDADVIFLKNIDNVVPDHLKPATIKYKKVIGGALLSYKKKVDTALSNLDKGTGKAEAELLLLELGHKPADSYKKLSHDGQLAFLKNKLHRPLRVCGMVKAEDDTGGGPFWTRDKDGSISLQIAETAQINLEDPDQKLLFENSTHFNPVDVACSLKDKDGVKFDLMKYRDLDAGFITKKSKDGRELKAQELPGLWNGSTSDWNTVFVEVPMITFNPVKSIHDLLKDRHQEAR